MAGKTPILLAAVLFAMGTVGLLFTAGETTRFGPFEPGAATGQTLPGIESAPLYAQSIIVLPQDGGLLIQAVTEQPPEPTRAAVGAEIAAPPAADLPAAAETPTPPPPLFIAGVAADDAGVQAAGATPPPIRIIMVAGDGAGEPAATPAPERDTTEDGPEHQSRDRARRQRPPKAPTSPTAARRTPA